MNNKSKTASGLFFLFLFAALAEIIIFGNSYSAVWLGTEFTGADIIGFIMIISTIFIILFLSKKKGR